MKNLICDSQTKTFGNYFSIEKNTVKNIHFGGDIFSSLVKIILLFSSLINTISPTVFWNEIYILFKKKLQSPLKIEWSAPYLMSWVMSVLIVFLNFPSICICMDSLSTNMVSVSGRHGAKSKGIKEIQFQIWKELTF